MWCWLYSFIVRQSNYLIFAVIWSTFFEFLLFFLKVSLLYSTFFLGHRKLEVCAGSDPRSATQLELCEDQHNREETTSPALFLFQTFASFEWISDCMTTCTGRRFFVRQSADRSACWEVSERRAALCASAPFLLDTNRWATAAAPHFCKTLKCLFSHKLFVRGMMLRLCTEAYARAHTAGSSCSHDSWAQLRCLWQFLFYAPMFHPRASDSTFKPPRLLCSN